ncbi:uncharacterized protein [Rutidosis leptorrhynchoides]|uniref:uncharacterized protein n=1 Tax=Rutidosis leptorrhynchoides TaxID=125765 RepID=UPI003A99D2FE
MAEHDSQTQLITELTSQLARILQTNNENQSQRHPDSLKISVTLNNSNYSLWSRMIKVAIGGKSEALLNHLTEDPPSTNNQKWNQEDLVVFSWIIQNIEPQIASNLTQFPTAKTLWNALITTYSSGKDKLQTFDLHVKANNIRQDGKSTEELWLKLQGIWGEIDTRDPNPMEHPNDIVKYNNIRSEQKLFQFLNSLDHKHDNIKRELLRTDPLPTVEGAYAAIRKENAHQFIFNKTDAFTQSGIATGLVAPASKSNDFDGHGLLSRNQQRRSDSTSSSRDKDNLECTKCGMKRHTREQCFKVIGYPDWWADKHRKGKASMVTTATTKGKQEDNETGTTTQGGFGLFTAEPPSSSSSSGEGNRGLGLGIKSLKIIPDKLNKVGGDKYVDEYDGLGVSDIRTGEIVGRGTERDGLYYVDEVTQDCRIMLAHGTPDRQAWLWHRRLGHPQMQLFCEERGIIHQTTCPHTPQQNGVAERKNRILLEITRALMIESNVPRSFWPEALATATYLVNRLPTRALELKNPLEALTKFYKPPSNLTLRPRIFGCTVFVHIPKIERTKLDACAEKCVFVGYGVNQKGYRCYSPKRKHMYTTMNCDFLETEYFYTQHTSQGETDFGDAVSWLDIPSSEEVTHHTTPQSPPPINTTVNDLPDHTEVNTESPDITNHENLEEILQENSDQVYPENETQQQEPERYVLPPRINRGIPPRRYSPERTVSKSRYPMANM